MPFGSSPSASNKSTSFTLCPFSPIVRPHQRQSTRSLKKDSPPPLSPLSAALIHYRRAGRASLVVVVGRLLSLSPLVLRIVHNHHQCFHCICVPRRMCVPLRRGSSSVLISLDKFKHKGVAHKRENENVCAKLIWRKHPCTAPRSIGYLICFCVRGAKHGQTISQQQLAPPPRIVVQVVCMLREAKKAG